MKSDVMISSFQNPKVKQAMHLRDRRDRDKTALFLIEGYRELLRAVDAKWEIESVFYCQSLFLGSNEETLIERLAKNGAKIFACQEPIFRKLSYRDRPDGLLATGKQKHQTLADLQALLLGKKNPFLIIAEAIEKPGNLGTILRSSDAVGVDALILCDKCTDLFNPNVVRASVGMLFTVPVIEASSQETLAWLKEQGIAILAATPAAHQEYTQVDMAGPLAIAIGTEQLGLSKIWMEKADLQVAIPMLGTADSLNAAMAATLLLYEALRQRRICHGT
jgi:TrmH family RNA methyltransferase